MTFSATSGEVVERSMNSSLSFANVPGTTVARTCTNEFEQWVAGLSESVLGFLPQIYGAGINNRWPLRSWNKVR